MASNERVGESTPEAAKEKPKVNPSDSLEVVTNAETTQTKVDSIGEPPRDTDDEVISDFFSTNESRLGYKSRLTLLIRKALVGLEYEASRQTGLPIERLRAEFLSAKSGRQRLFEEFQVRPEYVMSDYRVFLIFYIALIRRRNKPS